MHVPLGLSACAFNLSPSRYDSRVTTPPGLYLITAPLARCIGCDTRRLRLVNSLLSSITVLPVFQTLRHCTAQSERVTALLALAAVLNPVFIQCSAMYYTDGIAALLVSSAHSVACVYASHCMYMRAALLSSALYGAATLTRQNVAPFTAFSASCAALCATQRNNKHSYFASWTCRAESQSVTSPEHNAASNSWRISPLQSLQREATILKQYFNFHTIVLLALFNAVVPAGSACVLGCIALRNNGNIALGDADAHRPSLHLAQIGYAGSFMCLSLAPLHLSAIFEQSTSNGMTWLNRLLRTILLQILCVLCVHYGTFAHPYLLADNRHFTFYLYRRVIKRLGDAGSTLHALAWEFVLQSLSLSTFSTLVFFATTAASVVPSPLLEPRYYLPASLLALQHTYGRSELVVKLSIALNALACLAQLYIFTYHTFTAPAGTTGRFIW